MFLKFNVNVFVQTCLLDLFFKISQYFVLAWFFEQSSYPIHVYFPVSDKLRQYMFLVLNSAIYPKQKLANKKSTNLVNG